MGRKILAVIVALFVAMAVIMIVQMLNTMVVLPPTDDVMRDPVKLREFMGTLPPLAYIIVLIGYILGSFAGGFIVTKMARRVSSGPGLAILIGGLLLIGGILNFFVALPGQPVWFVAAALIIFIPAALAGHRLAR